MKANQILLHSLRQVTGNFDGALRISAVPYAIQFLTTFLLLGAGYMAHGDVAQLTMTEGFSFLIMALLNLLVVLITSIWAAVAWHRFVLKGEMPSGFVPPFNMNRNKAYFARSFGIGLLVFALSIPLGLLGTTIAFPLMRETGPSGLSLGILFFVTYLPLTVISYRLSAALPATALDAPGGFWAGWEATKGDSWTIIVLALISVGGFFVISLIAEKVFGGIALLSFIWQMVFGWFVVMVGLSILTTLYGHYIEKRPLV